MNKDTAAARALLAYFNRPLIIKLARHVLKESSPQARKALADAVIQRALKEVGDVTWNAVKSFVAGATEKYIGSAAFKTKLDGIIAHNADNWMREAMDVEVKERARAVVKNNLNTYGTNEYLKTVSGRFQAMVEEEMRKIAADKAHTGRNS